MKLITTEKFEKRVNKLERRKDLKGLNKLFNQTKLYHEDKFQIVKSAMLRLGVEVYDPVTDKNKEEINPYREREIKNETS